jgi:Pretoxin HINT domain/Scabin-like
MGGSSVKVGEKVFATDPVTGTTTAQRVTLLHRNHDTDLADVTVISAGTATTLHATWHHPFWNTDTGHWTEAKDLTPGTHLRTVDGSVETVSAVRAWAGSRDMRDLTVDNIHTYYVVAGTTPVLVHNCGSETLFRSDTRDPSEVFQTGFDPMGNNMDVLEHAAGWSRDSGYIATTRSEEVAIRRGGNVYEIRADGVDVNKEFPGNPFSHEQEVAVPGRIGPECIVACRLRDGTRVMNPNYEGT